LALLCAVALSGCGASVSHPAAQAPSPIARAQADHEYRSAPPPRQRPERAYPSPSAAIAAFAGAYINWTADSVPADMAKLSARSVGQARAATQLAAAQTAGDYELRRDGIANSGAVEAIAPLAGRANQYVVVTREQTTASGTTAYQGLAPAWHVTIATVTRVGAEAWVVSGWQPQS
jgi:hypothetical protein